MRMSFNSATVIAFNLVLLFSAAGLRRLPDPGAGVADDNAAFLRGIESSPGRNPDGQL